MAVKSSWFLAPYCVKEYLWSMLPSIIRQIDLKTILVFLECINPLNIYLPVDVVPVGKVGSLTIDKTKIQLFTLALLVWE